MPAPPTSRGNRGGRVSEVAAMNHKQITNPALQTPGAAKGRQNHLHPKYSTNTRFRETLEDRKRRILGAIPPADFYRAELSSWTPCRPHGWVDGGLCPFHLDRRAGSLKVNLDTGRFRCFSCTAAGSMLDFLMSRYGLNFMQALQELERRAGSW